MKYRNFLTQAILTSAICLLTVFVLTTEKAEAWGPWIGFSDLCVEGSARGPEGSTIVFTLTNVTVYTQCYNINGGNLGQPGVGNWGSVTLTTNPVADPEKKKGWVSLPEDTCISLAQFDQHWTYLLDENGNLELDENGEPILDLDANDEPFLNEDHNHTCWPLDNENKEEQFGSAWIADFVVDWEWFDDRGRRIKHGTDTCYEWTGELNDEGIPDHDEIFNCIEEVFKK